MKKNILFIANEIQTGGATKAMFSLINNLKSQYTPIVLINKKGPVKEFCNKNNIRCIILNFKSFSTGIGFSNFKIIVKKLLLPFLKLNYIFCNKLALRKIDKMIDMKSISLIHTNINRDDFGALLSEKYNIPHIWHLREFGDVDFKCYFFRRNYIDFMNKNTTYFIAISNVIKENFIKKGIDKDKIKVIYDGVKINKEVIQNKNHDLNILFLGVVQESKGQLELIEALSQIPKEIRNKITVDFYGFANKNYKKLLINKIADYDIKNIEFHSYINDVDNIMSRYNVGIMCSKSEAFGLVTVEYMGNKLITIVPNRGACPEIVTKNSGFIYKDSKDLADIIIKIYNMDIEDRIKLVNCGYERAEKFSDIKNAENVMKLYEDVLNK